MPFRSGKFLGGGNPWFRRDHLHGGGKDFPNGIDCGPERAEGDRVDPVLLPAQEFDAGECFSQNCNLQKKGSPPVSLVEVTENRIRVMLLRMACQHLACIG